MTERQVTTIDGNEAAAYVAYAYVFNLGYDRVFPIAQNA